MNGSLQHLKQSCLCQLRVRIILRIHDPQCHQTISIHCSSRACRAGNLVDVRLLGALVTERHTTTLILQGVLNSRKSAGP
jgi:hypothetical protein